MHDQPSAHACMPARRTHSVHTLCTPVRATQAPTTAAPGAGKEVEVDGLLTHMSQVTHWKEGMRLQMQTLLLAQDTYAIRSLDWDRPRFDIEFA